MKKLLVLVLVLSLFAALAACTQVTRISIDNPAEIKLEKAGGGMAVPLTEKKTVDRITDVVCQIPLQSAEATGESWTYRITWLDEDGKTITQFVLVAEVAAVELEAHIVVLLAKPCVEVSKDLNNSLSLRLYGCGILCLCVDTNAG